MSVYGLTDQAGVEFLECRQTSSVHRDGNWRTIRARVDGRHVSFSMPEFYLWGKNDAEVSAYLAKTARQYSADAAPTEQANYAS